MTNSFPPMSVINPLRRNRSPGEAEIAPLFQLLPEPAILIDTHREQVLLANGAFLQATAYSLGEVVGRLPRDLLPDLPATLNPEEVFSSPLERRARSAIPVTVQVRALDASGQWRVLICTPVEDTRHTVRQRMDRVVRALAELNQLPVAMPMRRLTQKSVETVQQLFETAIVSIYQVDVTGTTVCKVVETGEADLLPAQLPASDLLRLSHTFVWKPGRRVQTDLHRAARIHNLSFVVSTPLDQSALLVVAERGQEPFDHLGPLVEVISERISSLIRYSSSYNELREQAIENTRELLVWRQVAENAREGILLLAPDMSINEMNPAAEWMLGYADWEVKGQPVENVLIGPERLGSALETASEGIPTHSMGNVSLHRRNGQSFPAHVQVVPVQREGDLLAVMIFFSDVSEHEEIQQRTQQLEQRAVLGEVTAVFAHEVRNPINNISTGLQLLSVKLPEEDPNQENIGRLVNDCQRLNHLMESVLNFSRHAEHRFEEVNLEMLLKRILDRWRPRMAKVSVTAFFHIEEDTPHITGDPRSLEQVFTNLISNAVEAMSSTGGTLAVRVAPFSLLPGYPQVEVTVSDNGPGIPDEVRDRIFEPFVTTKPQGTGLGLAITKRIVTAHHGSMSVNTFPGGTVFHVLLPAFRGEAS